MRIPALPRVKEIENKRKTSFLKVVRRILSKRIVKKRPFVRIPPRK